MALVISHAGGMAKTGHTTVVKSNCSRCVSNTWTQTVVTNRDANGRVAPLYCTEASKHATEPTCVNSLEDGGEHVDGD